MNLVSETCQDCGSADSVSRDLPGLRIRLTAVPCILPERLESTWCHRDLPADQADHSPLISLVCSSGSLRDARDLPGELTEFQGRRKYAGSTTGPFIASAPPSKVEKFGFGPNTGETLPNFRQKSKGNFKKLLKREG
ncbi:hypothetical protein Prudu_001692 [Prunus dulcis]|uniref:Uncharacterized protein n=1 Tax=Prunus dulcis TaxID=3755 RepID=A0A4Y1QP76_PRUDU|nr:hypothetical protein Prudu_001692 [Prunus dulcis]